LASFSSGVEGEGEKRRQAVKVRPITVCLVGPSPLPGLLASLTVVSLSPLGLRLKRYNYKSLGEALNQETKGRESHWEETRW
jgi:hypothetical protein